MILLHGRILRGFPFGNDIMPARSAAVDLYRVSLPPRHRATVARWRGGKETLERSTAADRAGIISFPNGNPRKIRPCNKIILIGRKCIKLSGEKIEILLLNSQWTGDQHLIVRSREKMRFLENDLLTFLRWKSFKNSIQAFQNIVVDIRAKLWPRQCDEVQFREGFTKRNCGVAVLENYPVEYLLPTVKRNILYFHASCPPAVHVH